MFRKNYFVPLLFISAFLLSSISVFAQGGSIAGKVMLKGDTASTPVVGASVDCYNLTDFTQLTKSSCSSVKTNVQGEFVFSGLKADGQFIISVSAEGIGPRITLPIKSGAIGEIITVIKGDSAMLKKVEVWQAFAYSKNAAGGFSDNQKLAQAQYEKWFSEAEARNKKIQDGNAKIPALLKEGNAAYTSGNYDLALAKYDEGYNISPEFLGSAPIFLNNKGTVLKRRAAVTYNTAASTKDSATIDKAKEKAKKDLSMAISVLNKSYELLNKANANSISNKASHKKNTFQAVDIALGAVEIMVQIHLVDEGNIKEVRTLIGAFIKMESDKTKKGKAQNTLARYLMEAYDYAAAAVEFKRALTYSKKDSDVLAYLGLSLYSTGEASQKQEALNYMDYYLKSAPKDHKMRTDISALVKELVEKQKLKPQKINL